MFRKDKLTVKREEYRIIKGEAVFWGLKTLEEDIPCHLSVNLNNTVKINNAPFILSDFTLFLDFNPQIDIKENDLLFVTTDKSQDYKLYAGEVKFYGLTVQIKCRQEKITEG